MIRTERDGLEVDEEEILLNLGKDERIIICEPNDKYMFEGTYVFCLDLLYSVFNILQYRSMKLVYTHRSVIE